MFTSNQNQPQRNLNIQLPARLDAKSTADKLGFHEHDIPVLIRCGLLKPLWKPVPNARNYFATVYVIELFHDIKWLEKASRAVSQNWQKKNSGRRRGESSSESAIAE